MRPQQLVLILFSFLAPAAAELLCDPITEYEQNGACCTLCPPGTSMLPLSTCQDAHCQNCQSGEFLDKYNKDAMCQRQQSCDPNKNFGKPKHDPKRRTTCLCKEGFHCSSEACITCVSHKACGPGYGVRSEGNHSTDTVCERCSEGTFSPIRSQTEACRKWTECLSGQVLLEPGTDTSDSVCGEQTRTHVVAIVLPVVLVLSVVVFACLVLGKRRGMDRKVKRCLEMCTAEKKAPAKETQLLVPNADGAAQPPIPERQMSQEEPRTPEEVEDLSQEITITTEVHLTDNGKFVTQEDRGITKVTFEEA